MEAVECGAASLAIILGYYGRFVPLETLRLECGVSRDGSKAGNVAKAARRYGLVANGFRRPAESVLEGPFPSIVFWGFNHFLVVEGASGERVYLNDPATGPRTVSRPEFARNYAGVVLTFETSADFEKGGEPPKLMRRLAAEAPDYRRQLGFVLFVGVLLAVPAFLIPGFTAVFVNDILVEQRYDWLPPLLLAIGAAIVVQAVLEWLRDAMLLRLETASALKRSSDFLWHVLRLPSAFFGLRYLGDVANRVTNAERVAHFLTADLGSASIDALKAAILFGLMALIDPVLALISVAGALVNVIVLRGLQRAQTDASIRLQTDQGKFFGVTVIGLRSLETLKATGAEDDFFSKWAGHHARSINSEQRQARLAMAGSVVPPLIVALTTAAALAVGGLRVMDGLMTVGALLAFQSLFASLASPVQRMVQAAQSGQQVAADIARLDDVLNYELDWRHRDAAGPHEHESSPSASGLCLHDIRFGYSPLDAPLIEGLSLNVDPGGWIALVGSSGSGKSTIGKLICGLLEPWSGEVVIDGNPLQSFKRRELARLIAAVDQDIALFEGTVRDNICLWDRTVPQEDLITAARDAQIFDVISTLPGNFDASIEEGGRNLSGGQKQRIEIARALVRPSRILVLDEATSALDPVTELAIMNALRRRGMTCVVVAHRLSTIRDADEIIVLDQGQILERGRHQELLERGGAYARLVAEGNAA